MDLFRFFLARTDIISILNLTRNSPSHHRRFLDEIMAAIEFQIGPEMDFFRFFLQLKSFLFSQSGVIRSTTESLVEISPAVLEFLPNK